MARLHVVVCIFEGGFSIHCHSADDLRATHARTLLPVALASVSFGFVLVRVRIQPTTCKRAACGLAVPPYHRAKPINLPSNATDPGLGANYGYGPIPIISETETLRSGTFYFP